MSEKTDVLLWKYTIYSIRILSAGYAFYLLYHFIKFYLYPPNDGWSGMVWLYGIPIQAICFIIAGCKWWVALIILILQFFILFSS